MATGLSLAFAVLMLVAVIGLFIASYRRYRGQRIVTCPETNLAVAAKDLPQLENASAVCATRELADDFRRLRIIDEASRALY